MVVKNKLSKQFVDIQKVLCEKLMRLQNCFLRFKCILPTMAFCCLINVFLISICFAQISQYDSSGFVVLEDVLPEIVVELRYYTNYNFTGDRIRGYEEPVALVTKETASALQGVLKELAPLGYTLKVYDAYRPQIAVDHFVEWANRLEDIRMKKFFYPEESKANLFSHGYIASRSGHSRGSTVDVTLFDIRNDCDVDMGGTFDYFGYRSHADYPYITEQQKQNRYLLRNMMLKHGFRGIDTEWWHFTLNNEPYPQVYFNFTVKRLQ